MERRTPYLNKLLIVVGLSGAIFFAAYVWWSKRIPRYYYVPKGFHGWVTIRYEKPNAPALPYEDGAYRLYIPQSGILETSSKLEEGWARDEHYWWDGKHAELIPKQVENPKGGESLTLIHAHHESWRQYDSILLSLPDGCDTTLFEGTRIRLKLGYKDEVSGEQLRQVDIDAGRKLLEHFYVSDGPQPFFYISESAPEDSLPPARKFW